MTTKKTRNPGNSMITTTRRLKMVMSGISKKSKGSRRGRRGSYEVLSLVPDLLKVKLPSLCNLKSLKVKLKPLSFEASHKFRAAKLKNKSRKEAAKVRKALKAGFEPSETIPDGMLGFLLIDYCGSSRKPIKNDTSPNEDKVEKSQRNTHSPPLDNGL